MDLSGGKTGESLTMHEFLGQTHSWKVPTLGLVLHSGALNLRHLREPRVAKAPNQFEVQSLLLAGCFSNTRLFFSIHHMAAGIDSAH